MKPRKISGKSNIDNVYIIRQIQLAIKLLAIIATDKEFSNHTKERKITALGKLGFRQSELAEIFGVTLQYINNVFRKSKNNRS